MRGAVAVNIVNVSFYVVVAVAQRAFVSVEKIKVPRNNRYGARPVQTVVRAIPPAAGGDYVGQNSVGLLLVAVVREPFLINREAIVIVKPGLYRQMPVARPAVLLALRAVGGVAHEIGYVGLACGGDDFVEQRVRGFYAPRRSHVAVCEMRNNAVLGRAYGARRHKLHIAETLVAERGGEAVVAAAKREDVGLERLGFFVAAIINVNIAEVERAVGMQTLPVSHPDNRAAVAAEPYCGNARHILAEIVYISGVVEFFHALGRNVLHKAYRFHDLRANHRRGSLAEPYAAPLGVVILRSVPAFKTVFIEIKMLACVYVVVNKRTV